MHNHKPSYIIQHHNINPFIAAEEGIEPCGNARPTCLFHQNTFHYVILKSSFPTEVATSITMDVKSQGKVIINNPYILYIPTPNPIF